MKILFSAAITIGAAIFMQPAIAFHLTCITHLAPCIRTQGTEIPSKIVITMLDECDDFTRRNIGYRVITMSVDEILKANDAYTRRTGQSISPLLYANFDLEELLKSDLRFDRGSVPPRRQYLQIKRSCQNLSRDFNNESKWIK